MTMLKWHLRENARLIKDGKPPKDTPRYIKGPWSGLNRQRRRADEAKLRHKGDSPHGLGKRRPQGWRRKMRNARNRHVQGGRAR